jgi:hypothetical protein
VDPGHTTADRLTILDAALARIPYQYRYGTPILIGSDSTGCTHALVAMTVPAHRRLNLACRVNAEAPCPV